MSEKNELEKQFNQPEWTPPPGELPQRMPKIRAKLDYSAPYFSALKIASGQKGRGLGYLSFFVAWINVNQNFKFSDVYPKREKSFN